MRSTVAALSAILSIGFLGAAENPVSGPTSGFVFDLPTNSLRPVVGFLGSASLGPALFPKLDFASVAPQKNYAIGFQDGGCLLITGLDSEHVTATTLPDVSSIPDGVAWSQDGSVAVLYSRTGNWVRTISGLPGSPNPTAVLDLSVQGGTLSVVGADLHGDHIVVGMTGQNAGVFQIATDQSLLLLLAALKPISLAFADDGRRLYILDGDGMQLSELRLEDFTSQAWPITELEDPIAIRPARDESQRQVLFVVGRNNRSLLVYDASSHEMVSSVALPFQPAGIEILGKDSYVLRPRTASDDPLWSFRASAPPMVYFVPATPLIGGEDTSR